MEVKKMFEKLKKLYAQCGKKDKGSFVLSHIYRPIGMFFTWLLIPTPVTPNQITIFMIFIGFIGISLFALGSYTYSVIGAILLIFHQILDCTDGPLARYKKLFSKRFYTLDIITDNMFRAMYYIAISIGVYKITNNPIYFVFALFGLGGHMLCLITARYVENNEERESIERKKSLVQRIHDLTFPLFQSAEIKTILLVLALLNMLHIFLIIYGILFPLRFVSMVIYNIIR